MGHCATTVRDEYAQEVNRPIRAQQRGKERHASIGKSDISVLPREVHRWLSCRLY